MNIYLIRHGDAENISKGTRDFDRRLTTEGELKIKKAADFWKTLVPAFDIILSSPYIRALQTAKIIASAYNYKKDIITDKRISSGCATEDMLELVNSFQALEIAVIGHQPDLSNHTSILISGSGAYVDYKKGTIAKISFHNKAKEGKGVLEFLIPPNLFITK
jgi:phosphohistidine phosphatase